MSLCNLRLFIVATGNAMYVRRLQKSVIVRQRPVSDQRSARPILCGKREEANIYYRFYSLNSLFLLHMSIEFVVASHLMLNEKCNLSLCFLDQ